MRIMESWLLMKGKEIEQIREALRMSPPQFAQLLGVHISTVYRWASAGDAYVKLDPLHASLLARIQASLSERTAKGEWEDWAEQILKALLIGGTLAGLAIILCEVLPKTIAKSK